ncbi:hypothetical protein VNO77_43187 [Canavalia gladiata]|uniref:Uncharacterized protein n=1 Tax=Canavalia gladiata TaxID=3824 RepID=A0AAN9PP81_CANGL
MQISYNFVDLVSNIARKCNLMTESKPLLSKITIPSCHWIAKHGKSPFQNKSLFSQRRHCSPPHETYLCT